MILHENFKNNYDEFELGLPGPMSGSTVTPVLAFRRQSEVPTRPLNGPRWSLHSRERCFVHRKGSILRFVSRQGKEGSGEQASGSPINGTRERQENIDLGRRRGRGSSLGRPSPGRCEMSV